MQAGSSPYLVLFDVAFIVMMLLMHLITVSKPLHLSLHNIYDVVLQTTRQMLYVRNDITYPRTYHTGKLPYLRNKRR
jgi:hypothetical protein